MMPQQTHDAWPALPFAEWKDTCETLHLWTQIVGKVRTARTPWINHSWHVPLYPTPRGLTTSPIPHGSRTFDIAFDFFAHELRITTSDGALAGFPLEPRSVAAFHALVLSTLDDLGLHTRIDGTPNELADPIPFAEDETHGAYDAEYANRFARVVSSSARVLSDFRGEFIGKSSPVHFFWGSFDLAVTRFSGRRAPRHPGGVPHLPDWVCIEAYSHEVASAGFWPGTAPAPLLAFSAYGYPTPEGLSVAAVRRAAAGWSQAMGEFLLPYEAVRTASDPDAILLEFLRSTYDAVASLGAWDRESLEWPPEGRPQPHGASY
jgi:hypothetical protein